MEKDSFLKDLDEYFKNTPIDQVLAHWGETEKSDNVGPSFQKIIDDGILRFVKNKTSDKKYVDIISLLQESSNHSFRIASSPLGDAQTDECYPSLGEYFVDQASIGGEFGDDYIGAISIELSNGVYFQYSYSA